MLEIADPFVFGMSFLERMHAQIDFGTGMMQLHISNFTELVQIKATEMPITCILNKNISE